MIDYLIDLAGVDGFIILVGLIAVGVYAEIHWKVRDE